MSKRFMCFYNEGANTMNLEEMRAAHAELVAQATAIRDKAKSEDRALTESEKKTIDENLVKAAELKTSIDVAEDAVREANLAAATEEVTRPTPTRTQRIAPSIASDRLYAEAKRDFKLKAFTGPDGARNAYGFGRWLRASLFGDEASYRWCRDRGLMNAEQRVMSSGVNTAGGYVVPEQFSQTIIDLRETYGVARQACRIMPMASDTMNIPRVASGLTGYYVGEGGEITASDMALGQVSLVAKTRAILSKITSQLAEDSIISIADLLAKDAAWNFAKAEDDALFVGDGTSTYAGVQGLKSLFEASPTLAGAVDCVTATDTWPEVAYDDVCAVIAACPAYALPNAKWYCSPAFKAAVLDNLSVSAGGANKADIATAAAGAFMGYPIIVSPSAPTGTISTNWNNLAMCYFGDLGMAATLGTRRDITVAVDGSRFFEYDMLAIRVTERFALNVHDVGNTTTAGPVVAMIGKTS
jgi:HK97 family phage major capsid protein